MTAEPGTGRVFVSRGTHVMVVHGSTGKVLGDIPDTPRTHGIALAPKSQRGFITNGGDSTVTMFDLKSLAVIRKIPVHTGGLDGIMYDDFSDRIVLTNHSRPIGTVVAIDARTGDIVGTVALEDNAPEGAASDGKGKIFVNNEGKSTIQVIDVRAMNVLASWPLAPCVREADLHPRRARQQRHRRASGLPEPVQCDRHRRYYAGRQDHRRGPCEARGVPLPARVRPAAGTSTGLSPAAGGYPRPARSGHRGVVFRD